MGGGWRGGGGPLKGKGLGLRGCKLVRSQLKACTFWAKSLTKGGFWFRPEAKAYQDPPSIKR